MEIEKVDIKRLVMNPMNPRTIKDDKFKKLVKSIKEFPEMLDVRPIVVDEDMVVLGGNMRTKACISAGLTEVSIIRFNNLTEDKKKEFIVKDNVGYGEWDFDLLLEDWTKEKLIDWGMDLPKDTTIDEYTKKIQIPIYEPSDNKPLIDELFNLEKYDRKQIKDINITFNSMLNFYKNIPALTIAMAQGGDFIGGKNAKRLVNTKRKSMNSFFCSTDRKFKFIGRINEDVNTYCNLGSKGELFLQINQVALNQMITQSSKGGMTELYLDSGTYIKSFYTIICNPSSCKIGLMGNKNKRLHHRITWNNTCPKIISEDYKK